MTGFFRRNRARKVDGSVWKEVSKNLLDRAGIKDFRFHNLRHTFASWYMMNGGDFYELAKILGHPNIKLTERQDDGAPWQAGAASHRQNQQHGATNVEVT